MHEMKFGLKANFNFFIKVVGQCYIVAILLFLFLQITTLHHFFSFTQSLPLENLSVFLILVCVVARIFTLDSSKKKETIGRLQFHFGLFLSIAAIPLLSSFANSDYLSIFYDSEWRTLLKALMVVSIMTSVRLSKAEIDIFLFCCLSFFNLLGAYFLYRYLVLHEVRVFDHRPLLNIRHGDPNFLGTFFATITPLCWWDILRRKNYLSLTCAYSFLSFLFLSLCVFATQSRMAILAYLLFFTVTLAYKLYKLENSLYRRTGFIFSLLLLGIGLFFIINSDLGLRFTQILDKSNSDRVGTFINGIALFFKEPILGVGMHQAVHSFYENASYPLFQTDFHRLDVHNLYLKVLAELGIVGFCLSLFLVLYIFRVILLRRNFYLLGSLFILILCTMSVGISYKDMYYILLGLIFVFSTSTTKENQWPSYLP